LEELEDETEETEEAEDTDEELELSEEELEDELLSAKTSAGRMKLRTRATESRRGVRIVKNGGRTAILPRWIVRKLIHSAVDLH